MTGHSHLGCFVPVTTYFLHLSRSLSLQIKSDRMTSEFARLQGARLFLHLSFLKIATCVILKSLYLTFNSPFLTGYHGTLYTYANALKVLFLLFYYKIR